MKYLAILPSQHITSYQARAYFKIVTIILSILIPLVWLVSVWRHLPEFWTGTTIWLHESDKVGNIMTLKTDQKLPHGRLIGRGPYIDQHIKLFNRPQHVNTIIKVINVKEANSDNCVNRIQ